jgi:hypothetical protein
MGGTQSEEGRSGSLYLVGHVQRRCQKTTPEVAFSVAKLSFSVAL